MGNAKNLDEMNNLKVEITLGFAEAKILFQKIYEYEQNSDIMTLAALGKKICINGGGNSEKLEIAIEKIKNNLQ